jgi:oligosaccharyl transferase complex subunit OST4
MITDAQLYSLALFLGSASVLLIVLYHFLQVNAVEEGAPVDETSEKEKTASKN